ncbi:hypothetical protein AA101099_1143 [Neoasaia chiangmaiensis NBRC 101099]|uniref:Uncharacterized protein n=1 Tax=Neoasaia chiangmaiensis TaxID=320497 RepID=A0A1U9KN35_9PROT|nr:hypothetical protein [Neoasaia chiangmaiensis]AQS87207.1 hypothetical protein A0U93_03795 [Neoasaia chiangmaiensis]GBR38347.1 hypothetical protein AA101099_1143 [Neoasaia chiangmaiensis NBRC 101099]GEN15940.1 hypothetical protein NCH01_23710 [Neoasaia chiangmaiensis]
MAMLRHSLVLTASLLALSASALAQTATQFTPPVGTQSQNKGNPGVEYQGHGEHYTAHGRHSLPPGYQDAPSTEFTHGPDPDHEANVQRDAVTGADLSKFGSAYQGSNPTQSGQLGDSTGNGWVAPR